MTKYKVLGQDEQDEILVAFLHAQERDLYCLELNRERYAKMLETLPAGPWRDRITQLAAETEERIAEIQSIIAATVRQLPPAERVAAAANRIEAKKAEAIRG